MRSSGRRRMREVAAVPHSWMGSEDEGFWRVFVIVSQRCCMASVDEQMLY